MTIVRTVMVACGRINLRYTWLDAGERANGVAIMATGRSRVGLLDGSACAVGIQANDH